MWIFFRWHMYTRKNVTDDASLVVCVNNASVEAYTVFVKLSISSVARTNGTTSLYLALVSPT